MCPRDLEPKTTSNLISGRFFSKDYSTSVKFEIKKKISTKIYTPF